MTARERNERTVRHLFDDVIRNQQYDRIPDLCAEGVRLHRPGDEVHEGIDAYTDHYRRIHTAFPDFEVSLHTVVADAEHVATRFTATGTHEGELLGIAPTGTTVTFTAQILFRLENGNIVEEFHQSDRTSLRQQL